MKGVSIILRRLGGCTPVFAARSSSSASSLTSTLVASSAAATCYTLALSDDVYKPLFNSFVVAPTVAYNFPSTVLINPSRSFFSTAGSAGPSKIVSIETEEQLNDSLRKAQDESLPAIFYFTAVWCGPCKLISPYIGQLSEKYPHVTTYKIDIDQEGLATALRKFNINAVPTIQFFRNGKMASEVVGADVKKLSSTMEELYK